MDIQRARDGDLQAVQDLLTLAHLPLDGVKEHFDHFFVLRDQRGVIGTVGLELYDGVALLRSLAVYPDYRGKGWGIELTKAALEEARKRGIGQIFLLTETAEEFFKKKFGFGNISRENADPKVQVSVEFQSACPESCACMSLELQA